MNDEIYEAIKELPSISKTIKKYNLKAKKKLRLKRFLSKSDNKKLFN